MDQEGHPVGYGSGDIGGRWVEVWRCGDGDGQFPGGRKTPCEWGLVLGEEEDTGLRGRLDRQGNQR